METTPRRETSVSQSHFVFVREDGRWYSAKRSRKDISDKFVCMATLEGAMKIRKLGNMAKHHRRKRLFGVYGSIARHE